MIYILGEILIGRRRTLETRLNHSTKTLRYDMLCFVKMLKGKVGMYGKQKIRNNNKVI